MNELTVKRSTMTNNWDLKLNHRKKKKWPKKKKPNLAQVLMYEYACASSIQANISDNHKMSNSKKLPCPWSRSLLCTLVQAYRFQGSGMLSEKIFTRFITYIFGCDSWKEWYDSFPQTSQWQGRNKQFHTEGLFYMSCCANAGHSVLL